MGPATDVSHCPICGREMRGDRCQDWPQLPFCSPRCQLIDLGRWLGENYRIPSEAEGDSPAEPDEAEDP